jgi:hypothetical protein
MKIESPPTAVAHAALKRHLSGRWGRFHRRRRSGAPHCACCPQVLKRFSMTGLLAMQCNNRGEGNRWMPVLPMLMLMLITDLLLMWFIEQLLLL